MRNVRARLTAAVALALTLVLTACSDSAAPLSNDDSPLVVYATTGHLADAVANIAPEAHVLTMVGPGGDPHTYQPSTQDIEKIQHADVVLWNGLHLEAQMSHQLESLGSKQLAVGERLPKDLLLPWPETDEQGNQLYDPHVWNSPIAWSLVVEYVSEKLGEIDPENAETYRTNAAAYQTEIASAAEEAAALMVSVPEPRILITGHDAFNYFGDSYDLKVFATDFVSTEATLSAEELSSLARLIAEHRVPVIFPDNQANPQAIISLGEAVRALGWDVKISDRELYADSLGADPGVDTSLGALLHNATAIADALGTGR